MNKLLVLVLSSLLVLFVVPTAEAQHADPRVQHLAERILARVPDIPVTRFALGRRTERPARALAQARAIIAASDAHEVRWDDFARRGGWTHWNSHRDLPALIAAMALRESYMQPIVRLDGGARVRELPVSTEPIDVQEMQRTRRRTPARIVRADMGVMQVRAPSGPASACGVRTREEHSRLATDLAFGYLVGTCVMTNRVDHFVDLYTQSEYRRLRVNARPNTELQFYGFWGPRRNTPEAMLARELLVLERYNWGGSDLYLHRTGAGYARRVIREFEFFRGTDVPDLVADDS